MVMHNKVAKYEKYCQKSVKLNRIQNKKMEFNSYPRVKQLSKKKYIFHYLILIQIQSYSEMYVLF